MKLKAKEITDLKKEVIWNWAEENNLRLWNDPYDGILFKKGKKDRLIKNSQMSFDSYQIKDSNILKKIDLIKIQLNLLSTKQIDSLNASLAETFLTKFSNNKEINIIKILFWPFGEAHVKHFFDFLTVFKEKNKELYEKNIENIWSSFCNDEKILSIFIGDLDIVIKKTQEFFGEESKKYVLDFIKEKQNNMIIPPFRLISIRDSLIKYYGNDIEFLNQCNEEIKNLKKYFSLSENGLDNLFDEKKEIKEILNLQDLIAIIKFTNWEAGDYNRALNVFFKAYEEINKHKIESIKLHQLETNEKELYIKIVPKDNGYTKEHLRKDIVNFFKYIKKDGLTIGKITQKTMVPYLQAKNLDEILGNKEGSIKRTKI